MINFSVLTLLISLVFGTPSALASSCGPALSQVLNDRNSVVTQETAHLLKQLQSQPEDIGVRVKITYKTAQEPDFVTITPAIVESFLAHVSKQENIESVTGAKLDKLSKEDHTLAEAVLTHQHNKKLKPIDFFQFTLLSRGQVNKITLHVQLKYSSKMSHFISEITKLGIPLEALNQRPEVLRNETRRGLDLLVTRENLLQILEALKAYSVNSVVVISVS